MGLTFGNVAKVIDFILPFRYNCRTKACDGDSLAKVKAMRKLALSGNRFPRSKSYKFIALGVISNWGRCKGRKRLLGSLSMALLCITLVY